MTEQEAIGYLKTLPNRIPLKFFTDDGAKVYDEFSQVVTSALEKQIPKKVKIEQWICTKCDCGFEFSKHHGDGYYSIPLENKTKYCPNCGQAIDWSEKE